MNGRVRSFVLTLVTMAPLALFSTGPTLAQEKSGDDNAATILNMLVPRYDEVSGRIALQMADDLSEPDLRVMPVVGKGGWQSTIDLLDLDEIDLALIQRDMLEHAGRIELHPDIERKIVPIAEINEVAFHVVARRSIETLEDLRGRKVNFGPRDDGMFTAGILFDRLEIEVDVVELPFPEALTALRSGELDAAVFVGGVPVRDLQLVPFDDLLHLLPLPPLEPPYGTTRVTSEQYPGLLPYQSEADTITIANVLAAYGWPEGHPKHLEISRLVESFGNHLIDWKTAGPNRRLWRTANIDQLPGWSRW